MKERMDDASQIRQKKALSQVFLTVDWPAEMTIEKLREKGVQDVVEIGPGSGALTLPLMKAGLNVTALERDERFFEYMAGQMQLSPTQSEVINCDVLQYDLTPWLDERRDIPTAVVGNIPYHISTPIVEWLFPVIPRLQCVILLTQYEFAKRLAASPGNKDYGSLSVYVQMRSKVTFLSKVEKSLFKPQPKVDSALVMLTPPDTTYGPEQLRKVEKVCRASFAQRRKQLANSLKAFLGDKDRSASPVDLQLRPEVLDLQQFIALANFVFD